jgi:hypothetical protein
VRLGGEGVAGFWVVALVFAVEVVGPVLVEVAVGAMLETCGSAGKGASEGGCTFPVTES